MALANRMSLRPDLLWWTLNLALIILCLSRNDKRGRDRSPVRDLLQDV
jgi:hypothetical protein